MYETLLYLWFGSAVVAFVALLKIPAPYGRHRSDRWGPTIPSPIGWFLMEVPSPIILTCFVVQSDRAPGPVIWLFVVLWSIHYVNRSIVYPIRMWGINSRIPISVVAMGVVFHVFNGYIVGKYFGEVGPPYAASWLVTPEFMIGASIFLAGMWINLRSDNALLNQRKAADGRYIVPKGGLFEFVSSPNYFGEIVEWTGFALMSWSPAVLAFAVWTAANLAPRALAHHRWYKETFPDYPKQRKALIPFVV